MSIHFVSAPEYMSWPRGLAVVYPLSGSRESEQPLVRQRREPRAVLSVRMQVLDLVFLLDLDGRHLLEKFQRFLIGADRERNAVDDVTAQRFFSL